jgi:hypothetical protein
MPVAPIRRGGPFMSATPGRPQKPLRYPGRSPAYVGSMGAYIQTNTCTTRVLHRFDSPEQRGFTAPESFEKPEPVPFDRETATCLT